MSAALAMNDPAFGGKGLPSSTVGTGPAGRLRGRRGAVQDNDCTAAIQEADALLYQAKEAGRAAVFRAK